MVLSFFQDIFCAKTRNKDSEFDQEDPLTEDDFAWNANPKEKYLALDLDLTIVHCTKLTVEAPSAAGEVRSPLVLTVCSSIYTNRKAFTGSRLSQGHT